MPPGQCRSIPQYQKGKGTLILTAALELSTNQLTHFYSKAKNTAKPSLKLYKKLLEVVQTLLSQVAEIQPRLRRLHDPSADGLNESLDHYLPLVKQVIAQTQTRVLHGKPAAAREKVLSLFEPHTALICRGKAKPKETEFGRKIWYAEVDGGLVSEYRILKGNPEEAPLLLPSLRHHCILLSLIHI